MEVAKGLLFLGFVALGLTVAYSIWGKGDRRGLVNVFLVYTLVLGLGAGLSQREAWPFSTWPLVAGLVPPTVTQPRMVAIDTEGREYPIDYRAWAPFEMDELVGWQGKHFFQLDRAAQDRVSAYLLGIIEGNRQRWAAGKPEPYLDRYFGPLSAPLFLGHPEHWTKGTGVPTQPFRGLRLYNESWNVEERWRDPTKVVRQLAYEYREP
jgi:hypothetical protein